MKHPTPAPTSASGSPPLAFARVTLPGGRTSQLPLGSAPLAIGSGPQCQIRLPGGPPLAATLCFQAGVVAFHNRANNQSHTLRHGSRLQFAGSTLEIVLVGPTTGAALPAPATAVTAAPGSPSNPAQPTRPLAAQLHGLAALSALFVVFIVLVPGFTRPSTRELAVFLPVALVYLAYSLVACLLWFRFSQRSAAAGALLGAAVAGLAGLALWAWLKSGTGGMTPPAPAWAAVALVLGLAAGARLLLLRSQSRPVGA